MSKEVQDVNNQLNENQEITDVSYLSLSSRDDLDDPKKDPITATNYAHYDKKLFWALDNRKQENIKNIAITGYYGSGKSSILKTFIKNYDKAKNPKKGFKFLELSLATFHEDKKGTDKVKDIEKSLLQQIFYKVKDQAIPNSRFKKITDQSNFSLLEQGLIVTIILALMVRLYCLIFSIKPLFGFYWIDVLLVIATLFMLLLNVNKIHKLRFKRLTYKSLEIEIEKNKSELSILSRFLDEIIYFFRNTKYNVVVIEDIDRFESTEIFSNLRELNLILNSSDLIDDDIVFIYAIKNEQFKTASDRTKFFDFIIPVIPVVNYETSAFEFKEKLKESDIKTEWLDGNMVNSLFYLEDDIRIINNTLNELITYFNVLSKEGGFNKEVESKTSLLNSLIPILFYKNVDPYDFSCLLKRKGFLHSVLKSKESIKEKHISIIKSQIDEIENSIKEVNNKAINNTKEVKYFVINILKNLASKKLNVYSDTIIFDNVTLSSNIDEIFDILIKNNKIIAYRQNNNNFQVTIDILDVENQLNFKLEERINQISIKNSTDSLKAEIKRLEEEIHQIESKNLAGTINDKDIEEIVNLEIEKNRLNDKEGKTEHQPNIELIKKLILNNYINKDYFLFLSDYSKLGMSLNDYKVLISIKNKKNIGFEKKIDNSESILKKLSPSDYNSNAILNYNLVDYIIKTTTLNDTRPLGYIIDWLSLFSETSKKFLIAYIKNESKKSNNLIKFIGEKSKDFWYQIIKDEELNNYKNNFYTYIIINVSKERILDYCQDINFRDLIENDNNLTQNIFPSKFKYIIENIDKPLKIKHIDFNGNIIIIDYIFQSDSYAINEHNIFGFINHNLEEQINYESQLLTIINQKDELVEMRNYIYSIENLELFIQNILLQNPAYSNNEEESIVVEILNMPDEKVSFETKKYLLKQQELIVKNITEIEDSSIRLFILKTQRMESNPDNILSFYKTITNLETAEERNEAIEDVVKFIINFDNVLNVCDETQRISLQKLIELCLPTNSLDNNIYKQFVSLLSKRLPRKDFNFTPAKNLKQDKFKILIEESYLNLSNDNINFMIEEDHQDLLPLFFKKQENKLIEFFNIYQNPSKHEEGIAILKAKIQNNIKTELVNLFFQNGEKFLDFTEFRQLLYEHLFKTTNGLNINNSILQKIATKRFETKLIPKIFNVTYPALDRLQIKTFFENRNNQDYKKLSKHRKRPSFENNVENRKMLDILLDEEIITGYDENSKDNKFTVKFVNKY